MNTIKSIVIDYGSLYKAMKKCQKGVLWKDAPTKFSVANGLVNLYILCTDLENDRYDLSPYGHFTIYEPKERPVTSTNFRDRVVQRSLCDNYLYDALTKSFIRANCACQTGKGTSDARDLLVRYLHEAFRHYGINVSYLKGDIKDFFGSTKHTVAKIQANKVVSDEWVMQEICRIIDSFEKNGDHTIGMGLGSQITQLLQLSVLNELDHFIKERLKIKWYVRYMDDFILIHPDKFYLHYCYEQIGHFISEKLELVLSTKKTKIAPVTQPIHFLGFSYFVTETGKVIDKRLPEKVSHERRKLKRAVARAKAGLMPRSKVDEMYNSWRSCTSGQKHGSKRFHHHTHSLVLEMDQFYKSLWEDTKP